MSSDLVYVNPEALNSDLVVNLKKPYVFEGVTYNKIDLSGLENLTASDQILAEKRYVNNGNVPILSEMTLEYACQICVAATGLPFEFFAGVSLKTAAKIKTVVRNFTMVED